MIRTQHFDFNIRFWPISTLMSKILHRSWIRCRVLSVINAHDQIFHPKLKQMCMSYCFLLLSIPVCVDHVGVQNGCFITKWSWVQILFSNLPMKCTGIVQKELGGKHYLDLEQTYTGIIGVTDFWNLHEPNLTKFHWSKSHKHPSSNLTLKENSFRRSLMRNGNTLN